MKIIFAILLFIPFFVSAQQKGVGLFALGPNGFRAVSDDSKNYIVIEKSGASKHELYTSVLAAINNQYISPKSVISKVKDESISIYANAYKLLNNRGTSSNALLYVIKFNFKDGRFKIGPIMLDNLLRKREKMDTQQGEIIERSLFSRSGERKKEGEISNIEQYFNNLLNAIVEAVNNEDAGW